MIKKFVRYFGDAAFAKHRKHVLWASAVLIVLIDLFMHKDHTVFVWEKFPGWSALFGFASCAAIIFVSKFLGHRCGLMQREDYYRDKHDD